VKQFILKEAPDKDGIIRLTGKDYRYLVKVRRLKRGDDFTALLPHTENCVTVSVLSTDNHTLTGCVVTAGTDAGRQQQAALPPIILFQAMPKETRMDLIVRQAAEGGISEIVPFFAEHSIPQPRRNLMKSQELKTEPRVKRWERIIKEARQQSGSAIDTRIRSPFAKKELFDYWKQLLSKTGAKALGFVFCLSSDLPLLPSAKEPLAQGGFHHYLNKEPPLIVLAIGPEGGFSPGELAFFTGAGFKPVNMGETILRTETAACYAAAAVKITLMEKAFWTMKNE
jgi:16S rRNA (uracil1498-N3)-methyltransferase